VIVSGATRICARSSRLVRQAKVLLVTPRVASVLMIVVVAVLPIALTAPFVNAPLDQDEAAYAVIARGLLRGELPYQDLFDHKPPMIYGWYAVSFLVFGDRIEAPRLAASLVFALTSLLILWQAVSMFEKRAAYVAAVAMGAASGLTLLQMSANTEIFMLLPMVGALVATDRGLRRGGLGWFLLAGILSALAVLTKQVSLAPTIALGLGILVLSERRIFHVTVFTVAGFTVLGLVLLPFVIAGAVQEFIYANVEYNLRYAGSSGGMTWISVLVLFPLLLAPLLIGAALGLWTLLRQPRNRTRTLLLFWIGGLVASQLLATRVVLHYWVGLFPMFALLSGLAMQARSWEHFARLRPTGRMAVAAAISLPTLLALVLHGSAYLAGSVDERHLVRYGDGGQRHIDAISVAARVQELSAPTDAVYEFGRQTMVYYYADRSPAVRFIYDRSFWLDADTLAETVTSLRATPPVLILVTPTPIEIESGIDISEPQARDLPSALAELLDDRYDFVEHVAFADIYQLRTSVSVTAPRRP
jgi:dolichyl-phosphate-mannose-protein mannosyltransferase